MSLSTTPQKSVHPGNDLATSFTFSYKVNEESDVEVWHKDSDDVFTKLSSNYTVTINADQDASPGGTVTYPNAGSPLPTGEKIVTRRAVPKEQIIDLETFGFIDGENQETALDTLTMQVQDLAEEVNRAAKFPLDETPDPSDTDTFISRAEDASNDAEAAETAAVAAKVAAIAAQAAAEAAATASSASADDAAVSAAATAALIAALSQSGTFAARPASPSSEIVFYVSTDTGSVSLWLLALGAWITVG